MAQSIFLFHSVDDCMLKHRLDIEIMRDTDQSWPSLCTLVLCLIWMLWNNYLSEVFLYFYRYRAASRASTAFYTLTPTVNIHTLKVLSSRLWWRKQNILSPLWIYVQRESERARAFFSSSDISNTHMFVLKIIQIFFFLLSLNTCFWKAAIPFTA